jgi:hypothetical protein
LPTRFDRASIAACCSIDPTNDPNDAYDVIPAKDPPGWWTVACNGIPAWHFVKPQAAQRYATDPQYRASLVTRKLWERG